MMKTRILYVCDGLVRGGAEQVLVDIIQQLDHDRFDAHLCLLRNENAFVRETEGWHATITSLGMRRTFPRTLSDVRRLLGLVWLVLTVRPHVIQSQGQDSDLYAQLIGRLLGIRVIISMVHNTDVFRFDPHHAPGRYALKMRVEDWTVRAATCVVAVTDGMRTYLEDHRHVALSRVVVMRNAVVDVPRTRSREQAKRDAGFAERDVVVGFLGRLAIQKNLFTAVHAFAGAARGRDDLRFVVVGDGPLRDSLRRFVDELGIRDRVHFAGSTTNVHAYLESFDMLVLPSFAEGLPLALLEAMSMEIPTIATPVGGVAEFVVPGETGFLIPVAGESIYARAESGVGQSDCVDPEQSRILQHYITLLADTPELRDRLGKNARSRFERDCSMTMYIERWRRLYDALLRGVPAAAEEVSI